ncbi:MAG: serine/threonine protein kinase [Pirellula sp.]|nr:serine/threonine protein kinase [Pirellula sp.]
MGIFDSLFKKNTDSSKGNPKPSDHASGIERATKVSKSVDIEARFERLRSAISGTMGNFFVAKDRFNGNRVVGVKLCDTDKVQFFENRFKGLNKPSEGEIAIGLNHSNIVETYEYGTSNRGQQFIVMEYIDGPGLHQLIAERKEDLLSGKRLDLITQMAEALAYLHRKEFIHRDICPRNYIVLKDMKKVKLIDFGLTLPATKAFMAPGNRTGTPLYMSPEIVRRRSTDKRVDIFSFAVTCYHLIAFDLPWQISDTTGRAALQHDTSPPREITEHRPEIDKVLAGTIMAAMHPNPELRTPDMDTFLRQLRNVKTSP